MLSQQVCFILPKILLGDLDKYCEKNNLNRSEVIRHLIRIEIYHEKSLDKEVKNDRVKS